MTLQTQREFVAAGQSHVRGRTDLPMIDMTIPALLRDTAGRFGENDAAVFCAQGIRWSYARFADEVDLLAGGLLRLGFAKGDRLGIWSPNRIEWLLAQFATARLGVILVCVNPAYRIGELEYALNKVGCKGLITARAFKTSDYVGMLGELAPELADAAPGALRAARLPHLTTIIAMGDDNTAPAGMFGFDAIMQMGRDVPAGDLDGVTATLAPDDAINIQFTSGTTGNPKGACLTHRNIVNNAHFVTRTIRLTDRDRLCIPVPFYHCFGMVMGTMGCVTKGATMVIPGEGFDPEETLAATAAERCTALYGVPTMFLAELDSPNFAAHDLGSLRTGIMAGALCPIEVMKRVQADMNMTEVTIAYGMTETSPVSFQSNVDDPLDKRVSSVGRVHPHVEVKIIDETGAVVPVGTQGELCTRGYSVMQGYWADPDKTHASIDADGWMHSGDLATLDAEGFCEITGRVKDMVNRGGENIYPREIEDFLFTHPAIAQAQVFGIPDAKFGEIACAWVVPKAGATLTEDEVKAFCQANIAHYKVPAHVRMKSELPMTVTGKPQKFVMRDAMIEELGL
ncbi:MAG: AMP-binding protein [Rhodobacteraceae bacterium]|nr:AMP-binding protein [Paracoccaceae bacterium]